MRNTIQEKYNEFLAGNITREKLLYEIRRDSNLASFITNLMSFNDAIKSLKNRGILTEAVKKATTLTLDNANPWEVRLGLDYELGLCNNASPARPIDQNEVMKAQSKVLKNLAKDPNYYTNQKAGQKAIDEKTKSSDMVPVKKGNFVDKKNAVKVGKKVKANVKDTLGDKEKAKSKNAKGVKVMTVTPKKAKGVKVMKMPGKEKVIKTKLKESVQFSELFNFGKKKEEPKPTFKGKVDPSMAIQLATNYTHENLDSVANQPYDNFRDVVRAVMPFIPKQYQEQYKRSCERVYGMQENIPASTSEMVPFANLQVGQQVTDDSGKNFKIAAIGNYDDVKAYDTNGTFNKFLSSDPTGVDATQLVAITSPEGDTSVRIYGTGGVYAFAEGMEAEERGFETNDAGMDDGINTSDSPSVTKFNEDIDDENDPNLKSATRNYLDAKIQSLNKVKSKLQEEKNKKNMKTNFDKVLDKIIREGINTSGIPTKPIPADETEKAEAKAAIMVTIAKAELQNSVDLDNDVKVENGHIWVKVVLGDGFLDKEQIKSLSSDGNFIGVNPIDNSTLTLIFKKA